MCKNTEPSSETKTGTESAIDSHLFALYSAENKAQTAALINLIERIIALDERVRALQRENLILFLIFFLICSLAAFFLA